MNGVKKPKMSDYCITWKYIVDKMSERFNIQPDNEERYEMWYFEKRLELIWEEYFDELYEKEFNLKERNEDD